MNEDIEYGGLLSAHDKISKAQVQQESIETLRAERDSLRAKLEKAAEAIKLLLATPEIAECDPRDKDEETHVAERKGRAILSELSADAPAQPPQISDEARTLRRLADGLGTEERKEAMAALERVESDIKNIVGNCEHAVHQAASLRSLLDEAIAALEVHSCACGDECFEGKREGLAVPIRACIHWKTKTTLAKLRAARND